MNVRKFFGRLLMVACAAAAVFAATVSAKADKLNLKDGRVLEGTITSETADYVYFKIKIGGIESTDIYLMSDIKSIDRDSGSHPVPVPEGQASAPKPGETTAAAKAKKDDGVHKVCILNFGPPSSWSDKSEDMVGVHVCAVAFDRAIPMMEKAGVDTVVIRINSGGGALSELAKFHKTFDEYKKKFRTVAWVESAISCAAMSPWVIEEFYMMPKGSIGACTGWSGSLVAVKGEQLEMILYQMEEASKKANRDTKIMRAMEIMEPLSVTIDPVTGKVTWYQDETSGEKVMNPKGRILTFNAQDAVKYKFAKSMAATKEELCEAMFGKGAEYEFACKEASDSIDKFMRDTTTIEKAALEVAVKYYRAVQLAASIQDPDQRAAEVGRAKSMLKEIEGYLKQNPNLMYTLAGALGQLPTKEWFTVQRERLNELLKK